MQKDCSLMILKGLHQQKFLVVSVLSNSPWLPKNLKNGPK